MKKRLVRALAWVITAGLLFLLFRRIPISEVVTAARGAAGWTVPAAFLFGIAIYLADSFAIWKTFGWFLAELSFTDVLLVRGATYLLALVNYNVGQGAIVYFVHRVARVPVMRGVATVLLIMGVNVLALLFLATFGLAAAPAVPHAVKLIVAIAYAGLAVYVAAVIVKPRWLASRPLFDVLLGAGLGGHLRALLVRLPHIAILFTFQIVMLRGFGVAVPILQAVAALPVVFFIAVLPISVQGLGTTQAALIYFFARYAAGDAPAQQAAVLAASLVGQVCGLALQATLGVACLRSRIGRAVTAASAEAQASAEAPASA
ncbi:MAG TPA: hypothetical protein VH853_10520 [Polyangia bacterium]|jgi:hypothetical protein|nr:hypothetical protein [Polyangia bacterium]